MVTNYTPESCGFPGGMLVGPSRCEGKTTFMLADNAKAKRIIRRLLKEGRHIETAELGLDGDWSENSCEVYDSEGFHKYDAYAGSLWATPILIIYFIDAPSEMHECWKPRK